MPSAFKIAAVVGKSDATSLPETLDQLAAALRRRGLRILMDPDTAGAARAKPDGTHPLEELAAKADLGIVVGGDGTFLACARRLAVKGLPLVGVNLGRLGFLTDIPADTVGPAIESVLDGDYLAEKRMILDSSVTRRGKVLVSALAMNDVVVSRGAVGNLIELAVTVDGEFICSMRADGLIVATPTGSTAYAISAGGPILHPALSAIALVPISPHTLSNRPIAIQSHSRVEISLVRGTDARAHFDMQSHQSLEVGDVVAVTAAPGPATILHPKGYRYFSMLRHKLGWNERTT